MRLAVELYGTRVGTLEGDARTFDFLPAEAGMARFGAASSILSVAIPLTPNQRRDHAGRRRNWFAELLPEGDQYDYMLAQGGIRNGDTPGFLAHYGRDVAGALQIWDLDDPTEPKQPDTHPLTDREIRALLEDPVRSPLANAPGLGKSSLGGVQPKIVLAKTSKGWAQALGGYPTSHILKPQLAGDLSSVIFDEEYGSRIARGIGLADFETSIVQFDGLATLVIERYDRDGETRIHQEDFNQVLGASRNEKYQEFGGVVSLQRIADALQRVGSQADLRRLAQMTVLAIAVGNLDMHTKNLGLLHPEDGDLALAPAYDVVPQAHMPNDGRLALAVNRKYIHAQLTLDDIEQELTAWGLRRGRSLVVSTLEEIQSIAATETPQVDAYSGLQDDILRFVSNLLSGKRIDGGE